MKKRICSLAALLLLVSILLSSCSSASSQTETKAEDPTTSPLSEESETAKTTPLEQPDPSADNVINVLMIGNSFCTYYPDELVGLAAAAGYDLNVYSVYSSGCRLDQHWNWYRINAAHYTFYMYEEPNGSRTSLGSGTSTLRDCLAYRNWDYISLQQHYSPSRAYSAQDSLSGKAYAKSLYNEIRTRFPKSNLLWHQTWAFQVGYDRDGQSIPDTAYQTVCYENIRNSAHTIAKENNVPLVPCGDAWQLARANPLLGDTLTRDFYHDGDVQGGQYLNACVWFEVLTKKSCLDNSFRPDYELSEEKIDAIKQAAHQAVAAVYGNDYAK